jgi:hypothetical protein
MIIKWLCKRYGLIKRDILIDMLVETITNAEKDREKYKKEYDKKERTEWSFYKNIWFLRGKETIADTIIGLLGEK